jgi:selenocysteine-specific translation elongation factor
MQGREATRLSQNEAVLQSMGVGDIGTTAGDVAAQSAGVAQDVERLNQSNWAGMLDAMGATAQEIARADVTSFGYRQGEDIAALRAAREDYLANVADREFELKFQQQQAKLQAQQEAAANAARIQAAQIRAQQEAAQQQARAEELQYERTTGFLRSADPLSQALGAAALNGQINATQGENVIAAYNDWISKSSVAKNTTTNRAAALADLEKFIGTSLSPQEKSVLRTAVSNTFNK